MIYTTETKQIPQITGGSGNENCTNNRKLYKQNCEKWNKEPRSLKSMRPKIKRPTGINI